MSEHRDYGQLVRNNGGDIGKTGVAVDLIRAGQVYQATHKDSSRLPYMNRSFISFSYGGRHIEDFNLLAVVDGDRITRFGYSPFSDITSEYDVLDGQQYWGTHFNAKELELHLATDGIDSRMLDDFLYWFRPGETKELILAEHPNRAILARLSSPPELHLLPFESVVNINISGQAYPTRTTLFRGEIDITFVMDEPHWYSKENLLGIKDGTRYIDFWYDANGNKVNIFSSQDALKILYEDGIPLGSMIQNNMLLGNGAYASVEGQTISRIWEVNQNDNITWDELEWVDGEPVGAGARVEAKDAVAPYLLGIIAGAIIDATGNGITSLPRHRGNDKNFGYFFYSGTAPSPTIIRFTLTPTIAADGYIKVPYNNHTTPKYNTLTIESVTKQELRFTTPNILTSYNKVIDIFKAKVMLDYSWEEIRQSIRDEVRHKYIREWAIKIIDTMIANNAKRDDHTKNTMVSNMSYVLKKTNGDLFPMTFTFNSETGEATGAFKYRQVNGETPSDWSSYGTIPEKNQEEDVGDMLRSNYIIIRDRNYPTKNGSIVSWEANGKTQSHRIYHDVEVPLYNLSILYKNMYL